ncbi:HlyD family secretion protein [Roseobacter denitrificans]|uniref:Multidrug resistance efflux pump, putative n=1 Tax=Roseobacter denitrificans (strain ATCC 33942 / OCh 114) TaxID=375451 RepID=Q162M1_ROSDO|nr:HlyD family secretion protein [Roseobacter denitrificans]ABG33072.1 multidrug resistance efflux pump, putative [Roseobacter denitrificans OCh 114]AVL52445.1 HlyD family secretion protein [Roseobacter denitrificans]SFG08452.1 Multidrug resistance efflux pump [Roseobacter denitrificans OCh 114]
MQQSKNPAGRIGLAVVAILIFLVGFYALTDRLAPSSARGIVTAHVVQIAPRVSGRITQVHVEDDAIVQAGDPLFSIDPRPFALAVAQAEANLASTTQNIDASSASLVAAQASVTQARTALETTRAQAERTFRLEERGIAAKAQGDTARGQVADAEARLATAEANLDSARTALGPQGEDNPAIAAAQAQLEQAQYDLASATVKAPHYGVVTNVVLSVGQFANAGNPALTFIDADAIWITVDLRENQLQNIDPGDPVGLLFDAAPGQIFEGRVLSIAWGINAGRTMQSGLVVNQPANRWFEPARRIPVRVELAGGLEEWPEQARVGGKVHAVIYSGGTGNPIAWLAGAFQRVQSYLSYLH